MSIDHARRIYKVCDDALKQAAMGEPYGLAVTGPAIWPLKDGQGNDVGPGPAWFVLVTIRASGVGEPDIGNGFPLPGILPHDDDFRYVAKGLLVKCRQEREQGNANVLAAVGAGPSMKLSDRPNTLVDQVSGSPRVGPKPR